MIPNRFHNSLVLERNSYNMKCDQRKFQVFISSTYEDLKTERQAVIKTVLDAGHIPAGMEFFTSYNETQLETMYRWIDESDFYLLVLGGSYGTCDEIRGRSYTQLEYERAIRSNKDVRVILLSDEYIQSKGITENDDYKNFKDLVSERAKEIANTEDGIERAVLKILIDYARNHDVGGWVRAEYAVKNDDELIHQRKRVNELQAENQELTDKIQSLETDRIGEYTFDMIVDTLSKRSIVDENGAVLTLLEVFIKNYKELSLGFILEDSVWDKLYGSLSTFQTLGLLWIATSLTPQRLRVSKNGRKFYARQQLLCD